MVPLRIAAILSLLVAFCVLSIALFPSVQGPYSVVNGPTAVMRAAQAAIRLRAAIIYAALGFPSALAPPFAMLASPFFVPVDSAAGFSAPPVCALRC